MLFVAILTIACIGSRVSVRCFRGVRIFYATMLVTTMGMIACRTPSHASMVLVAQVVVLVANRNVILRSIKPGPLAREHELQMRRALRSGPH